MRVLLLCLVLIVISCAETSRSAKRNLNLITPGEEGGVCTSQIQADIKMMDDICNVNGYSWQKNDIYMNCFQEVNSIRVNYPKLNCSIDGEVRSISEINTLYENFKARIYNYKTGFCGSEPIMNYNEIIEQLDLANEESRKQVANKLDDFADRYFGINCETRENEILYSSSSQKIQLTRELINKVIDDIENKKEITATGVEF